MSLSRRFSIDEFNEAFHAVKNWEPFKLGLNDNAFLIGNPRLIRTDNMYHGSAVFDFFKTEIAWGTLRYVFYINEMPISFEGAFGYLIIPHEAETYCSLSYLSNDRFDGLNIIKDIFDDIQTIKPII